MEEPTFRLTLVGPGGVGGLLSAPLVRQYGSAVTLVAHGKRGEALRRNGLTLHSDLYGTFTVQPAVVAETPAELPVQDYVLICVKNGALPEVAKQIAPIVGPDTVVLPVMNGVTAGAVLREQLTQGIVLESVIYTVSGSQPDYSIVQQGKFTQLFAGAQPGDARGAEAAKRLVDIIHGAGIDCRLSEDVRAAIWSKYVLNCAYNVATARWGCLIGGIKGDPARMEDCRSLMTEAWTVGRACGVALPEDLVQRHMVRIEKTTNDSDSSLGRDFAAGRAGEMEVFSGDLIRMARQHQVDVPVTERYYAALRNIAARF